MSFLPISVDASGWNPANITRTIVAGLLPFVLAGCLTQEMASVPVEPIPFWVMEYAVRTGESDRMTVTYGWRYGPAVKERVEAYLSKADRKRANFVFQSVLEHNRTGITSSWGNPATGHSGVVTPTRTVTPKDQPPCRDFVMVFKIGGNEAHGYGRYFKETGTACREDDGVWQVVEG